MPASCPSLIPSNSNTILLFLLYLPNLSSACITPSQTISDLLLVVLYLALPTSIVVATSLLSNCSNIANYFYSIPTITITINLTTTLITIITLITTITINLTTTLIIIITLIITITNC